MADHLFLGIVCTDISSCTTKPKSLTDPSGDSGRCWLAFLDYLDLLKFEERPTAIVLECVRKLDHTRRVRGKLEKGTALVVEALEEHGYVGKWVQVSATQFSCPKGVPGCGLCFSRFGAG